MSSPDSQSAPGKIAAAAVPASPRRCWVDDDAWPVYEGELAGDREGILALRALIDEALEKGVADSRKLDFPWTCVRIMESHPHEPLPASSRRSWGQKLGCFILMCGLLYFAACLLYGCAKLPELMLRP